MPYYKEHELLGIFACIILVVGVIVMGVLFMSELMSLGEEGTQSNIEQSYIEQYNVKLDKAAYNEVENMRFIKHENTGLCFGYIIVNEIRGRAITNIDCALIEDQLLINSIE
jgi:hypothetical protein